MPNKLVCKDCLEENLLQGLWHSADSQYSQVSKDCLEEFVVDR